MVTRWWSDKSPGLKILWVWTLGTAAIMMTNVVRTRMRDMDEFMKAEDALRSDSQNQSFSNGPSQDIVVEDSPQS